jgi:hypothetical protein
MVSSGLLSMLIAGFFYAIFRAGAHRMQLGDVGEERSTLLALIILQAVILFLFGTAQTSGGIITEADEGTIDYQRMMPVSPMVKVLGYLFGLPVREYFMFLCTVPFSLWAFWKGQVPWVTVLTVYATLFTSTLLYHLTGLLTGTVVKNRRWAFLASIALVFALYTILPQLAKFGLVFFKYLGITPVVSDNMQFFLPREYERLVKSVQDLTKDAPFFNLKFPEAAFVLFSQGGLIVTFLTMLYRRWSKQESLLLGKLGAVLLNAWVHLLILGNALPLVAQGDIFPSRGFNRFLRLGNWQPQPAEAAVICIVYAMFSYLLTCLITNLCTSHEELQRQAWRRARKVGESRLSGLADAATSYWVTLIMGLTGVVAWYFFARGVVHSKWFPGHFLTPQNVLVIGVSILVSSITFQAILESSGRIKLIVLTVIFAVVPLMAGSILHAASPKFLHLSIWLAAASPVVQPLLASVSELDVVSLPGELSRTLSYAFYFWGSVHVLVAIYWSYRLWLKRKRLAEG